jgi:hypothetical protein
MPELSNTETVLIFLLKFRIFIGIGNWWRQTETEAEVIVDPIFVHFNFAYFIFGGNFA